MKKLSFSALTSDLHKDPSILGTMELEAAARTNFGKVTITEHDGFTTVTAVAA